MDSQMPLAIRFRIAAYAFTRPGALFANGIGFLLGSAGCATLPLSLSALPRANGVALLCSDSMFIFGAATVWHIAYLEIRDTYLSRLHKIRAASYTKPILSIFFTYKNCFWTCRVNLIDLPLTAGLTRMIAPSLMHSAKYVGDHRHSSNAAFVTGLYL